MSSQDIDWNNFSSFYFSFYCAGDTNSSPTGPCDPGHYCTGGSTTPTQHICPTGHYCPKGSAFARKCPVGSYQESDRASVCNDCLETTYCDVEGLSTPKKCPRGYFCPSKSVKPAACPRGTYNPEEGKANTTECRQCDPGYFCGAEGLNATSGNCYPGYYCLLASPYGNPVGIFCCCYIFIMG